LAFDSSLIQEINKLSGDYIIARYPGAGEMMPYEQYDVKLAEDRIAIAKRIFARLESEYLDYIKGEES
jgi:HEPN domain-containing protein